MKDALKRFFTALPWYLLALPAIAIAALAIAIADAVWLVAGRRQSPVNVKPDTRAASLVIPNWNGKDLLERFVPSWIEAIEGHPGSEIIVVDNGSSDGSAEWLRTIHPEVTVMALPENLGFGGGSNEGFRAAKNDIVVLLNSDMRVEPDFLQPLLDGFTDEAVFAVSCRIFLSDPSKRREETGLTGGWWSDGQLRVTHREDAKVDQLFPCFYGGGGSCAFDRRKFLELGGFDEILAPFYLEDTDLGFLAWKRGWKVLYQPASVVWHEHRGTIGKKFSAAYIDSVLKKNYILFAWKNIHDWRRAGSHFLFSALGRTGTKGFLKAFLQLPHAIGSRRRARSLAQIDDTEAFRRSTPAYFHDHFKAPAAVPERPRVLFVSPYPICPPTHGGAVFMYNTLRELVRRCDVYAVVMLDYERELTANEELRSFCRNVEFIVRRNDLDPHLASIAPHAVHEFHTPEIEWIIEREVLRHGIDIIQLEYTALGQYAKPFNRLVCALFEHDVYFQSIGRALPYMRSMERFKARFEYLRAIRYELNLLPRCDHIQVCSIENKAYIESFLPKLAPRIDAGLRAGIDTRQYPFPGGPRRPFTMLFLGSFRHLPNQVALDWFTREVLPLILHRLPQARLLVAGSDPPPRHSIPDPANAIDLLGFVEDIQPLFSSCALFICPIRSGSGVRVKLLEAFASGIPVVSTKLGAEGLARIDGEFCALSDDPRDFASKAVQLLQDEETATAMALRARREVEENWDTAAITDRLVSRYIELLSGKRYLPND
jgi:GT2 family glycosyltransferase/glycosyltransferase involved in cell wall biosynthesis